MKCPVIDISNKKVGDIDLDEAIFGAPARPDILSRAVNWQLAKRQAGTHKTKQRAEVTGSTAKPFNQKGTGRARQGDKKAPHHRSGGVAFGPLPRSHAHGLTKKVRRLALKTALSAKQADGKLIVLDEAKSKTSKTTDLAKQVKKLGWESVLVIDGAEVDANFGLAARNIKGIDVLPSQGANVYDILRRDTLVLTKDAVEKLVERLK
ncbi:MAG: 50S ribosomal protein L4 [Rhodospirillaceae bacterium]|jgi:large subunit ribosomal protein L4|nr:50S ribosomal protein L4 [Rhodospirillaceae bacterium]MBT4587750.1 50S ribosomal protein L4 [Rhodospirillaceae bacterium]MBT7265495.1 50S ribosomal protein L4 [Rhodospirillaceae bacterium]